MKKFRFLFAVICGLSASAACWLYFSALEAKYEQGSEKIPVVFAARYIEQSALIEPCDVDIKKIPREYAQPGHLKNVSDLFAPGSETPVYMTTAPLLKGEQIIGTKLVRLGSETGLSALVPSGKRAFTMVCPGMNIKGIIVPGDKVDVLAVFEERVHTLLQNLQVLSIARRIEISAAPGGKKNDIESRFSREDSDEMVPVTVAVMPVEAQALALASEKGRVYLTLRPLGERTTAFLPPLEMGGNAKSVMKSAAGFDDFAVTAKKKYEEAAGFWKKMGYK